MDKLTAIRVFRRVIELGSFKAAAEDLHLSKAAISKNINQLEDQLKTPLINRTTRRLHITEKGQRYYDQVVQVLDNLQQADLSMIECKDNLRGALKVSIPMSLGLLRVNPAICRFLKLHPDISIEVVMADHYVDLVEQGIDISIRGGGLLKNSSLRSRKLIDIGRVVCASPDYLQRNPGIATPDALIHHNCLVYSLSSSAKQWSFYNQQQRTSVELKSATYAVNNGLALKQAVVEGVGVALTPRIFVQDILTSGEAVELLVDWKTESHALYAIYPYHKEGSALVRALIDFLASELTQ